MRNSLHSRWLGRHGYSLSQSTCSPQHTTWQPATCNIHKTNVMLLFKMLSCLVLLIFNSLCYTNHFNCFLLVSFLLSCLLQQNQLQLLTGYQIQLKTVVEPDTSESINTSYDHTELFGMTLCTKSRREVVSSKSGFCWMCSVLMASVFLCQRLIPLHTIRKGSHMYGQQQIVLVWFYVI